MDCAEFVELVTDYLEGGLGDADRRRVEEHLDLCDGCSTYLGQVRATIATLHELPPEEGSTPGRDRLLEAFRRSL
ncbi:MAG TPA: anti-sigma factor [Mycobacteriales bacterium]|nr:anti-sigma factor [Mycobacteriales bacterium]